MLHLTETIAEKQQSILRIILWVRLHVAIIFVRWVDYHFCSSLRGDDSEIHAVTTRFYSSCYCTSYLRFTGWNQPAFSAQAVTVASCATGECARLCLGNYAGGARLCD
jgi:hypothetical protein